MILHVPEIHCEGCTGRITKALTNAGIPHKVSLAEKTVEIEGDEETIEKAINELQDLGFSANR